ncbi:bile salt-activated lipase-like [Ptiloglossa arizonensis]|uniref:bile salt-activated lipase-like n=1 Tax=Ptiloglossa arizonensis TaxID=3350558 RepID=UPI003F9F351E
MVDRVKRTFVPSYFFKFSYFGKETTYADLITKRIINGPSHMDELSYLFYQPLCKASNPAPPASGTKDRVTMERLTTMWTNFAKTGNPTPVHDNLIKITWKPATKDNLNYLDIGDELELLVSEEDALGYK